MSPHTSAVHVMFLCHIKNRPVLLCTWVSCGWAGAGGVPKGTFSWPDFADFWARLCVQYDSEAAAVRDELAAASLASAGAHAVGETTFIPPVVAAAPAPTVAPAGARVASNTASSAAAIPASAASAASSATAADGAGKVARSAVRDDWSGGKVPLTTAPLWDAAATVGLLQDRARLDANIARFR